VRAHRSIGWGRVTGLIAVLLLSVSCGNRSGDSPSANDATREAIEAAGVDPSGELQYEHFFYFEGEAGARRAADELTSEGFDVDTLPPGEGVEDWVIVATRRESLNAAQLDALTIDLESLASRHGGIYDGWGTPL